MIKEKVLGIFVFILLVAVPASSLTENMDDKARQTTSMISIIDSWSEQAKLTALDGAAGDWLGCSISIDGDYAIVGAYYDDSGKGSAYIFKRNGAVWVQEAKLNASDGKESDQFGCSVSIDMNHAIVGAYGKNNWSGGAYVFKFDGTTWEEKAKLTPSHGSSGDYFGYSVSIDGSRVIVGAYGDGSGSGSAYIFTRGCCGWEEAAKLIPSKGVPGDYFGYSVSIYDIRVIVGAPGDDNMGNNSGSAYIFNQTGPIWVEEQKLNASDGETGDEFGVSVSMESKYIIVGAPGDDDMGSNSGSAYIFNQTDATWSQDAKLEPPEGVPGDYFGYSVSINGDYAIVGAPGDDDLGTNSGSAYVFRGYNQPPNAPNIHGPTTGSAGTEYKYAFNAEDPDDDNVRYHIDWGDNNSETTVFVPSGEKVWTKYNWSEEGTYIINATAEDNCGLVSPVATLEVIMPRNKIATNIPFLNFLQKYPNLFPIIQLLLQRLGL